MDPNRISVLSVLVLVCSVYRFIPTMQMVYGISRLVNLYLQTLSTCSVCLNTCDIVLDKLKGVYKAEFLHLTNKQNSIFMLSEKENIMRIVFQCFN